MKRLFFISLIICIFVTIGCVSNRAQQGAVLGGLTGMAGSALGKGDRETTAIAGGIGAVTGYIIGNEMDKNAQKKVETPRKVSDNERTECTKVIVRKVGPNGKVTETIEERCEGRKITNTY